MTEKKDNNKTDDVSDKVHALVGCNFAEPSLVEKYGTWFRVQVAFYDFIFESSFDADASTCNQAIAEDFAESSDPYKRMRDAVEAKYKTMEESWDAFVSSNTSI